MSYYVTAYHAIWDRLLVRLSLSPDSQPEVTPVGPPPIHRSVPVYRTLESAGHVDRGRRHNVDHS
jgi:hypothetical protein